MHNEKTVTVDSIWKQLSESTARGDIMQAGSKSSTGKTNNMYFKNGIATEHAFTILGTKELTDASGNKIKLLKMRNPWGVEEYKGDYSDKSAKWTPELRKQAGSVIKNNGEFFIPIKDYFNSFEETYINYNTSSMSRATFLVLNDTNTNTRTNDQCKGTCSYHKFTIKSKKTQKVHLKVTTW